MHEQWFSEIIRVESEKFSLFTPSPYWVSENTNSKKLLPLIGQLKPLYYKWLSARSARAGTIASLDIKPRELSGVCSGVNHLPFAHELSSAALFIG
jgi:hypothetical protein